MVAGSFNLFFQLANVATNFWEICYDFSSPSGSGNCIPSVPNANPNCSGYVNNTTSYYNLSGSGSFNGSTIITIQNPNLLSSQYCSLFFVYEKSNTGNCVLFSSLQSGASGIISGFNIALNDANRLTFETYDQNGPNIVTSSNIIGSKNAIAIVKSNNNVTFYYYNFNYQTIEPEYFTSSLSALYNSNVMYVGGTGSGSPPFVTENGFSGYLSEFLYINLALNQSSVRMLFSGVYAQQNLSTTGIIGYSDVTGVITGGNVIYTGIGTGITGEQIFLAGTYLDYCGNPYPIYSYNNMTGIISGYKFFPLTGNFIYTGTGIINQGYSINTGFVQSFGMDGFAYDREILSTDFSEFYSYPAIYVQNLNNQAIYNSNGYFILNSLTSNNLFNLYDNGIANIPSGYTTTGNIYIQTLILLGDYYTSGQSVISTGVYQPSDIIIYDYITGINEVFNFTGNYESFTSAYPSNRMVFLNGQKIVSGIDYTFSGNTLQINLSGVTSGIILTLPAQTGFQYLSGYLTHALTNKFDRGASQLWFNGQRQQLNNDYFEISKIDLLNGDGSFTPPPNILYNNGTQFLEFI